jgi:hypothetical protein
MNPQKKEASAINQAVIAFNPQLIYCHNIHMLYINTTERRLIKANLQNLEMD